MNKRFDVIVVGSGAGGGVLAAELTEAGHEVLLIEAGPYRTAADYMRWEARANHEMWWPIAFAQPPRPDMPPLPMFRGRVVGGTTAINTKVALRPTEADYAKWYRASGLTGDADEPFGAADLDPYFDRVEQRLGVRERHDWQQCVTTVAPAFEQLGAPLKSVTSYTDVNCMRCGSCLQGCPTNAGKNTLNTYIQPALVADGLELRPDSTATRVVIEDRGDGPVATGVQYRTPGGQLRTARGDMVVLAAGALATPGLLLRSGVPEIAGGSPSSKLIGRTLGFHPARLVEGLFDEIQDAHMVYPITAHCMAFASDRAGGYVVEASTIQDPIGFATALCDERGMPLWGEELVSAMRQYRYFTGLLTMATDENNGTVWVDEAGNDRYAYNFTEREQHRIDASLAFATEVLKTAGAKRVFHTSVLSTHVQGSCRMGSDPQRSVVNAHAESHDVRRLFIADSSVIPQTTSVNPSLTVMALASRLAAYLNGGEHGYFAKRPAVATA
jgi:choline dehydrogenase-like flavoprotein